MTVPRSLTTQHQFSETSLRSTRWPAPQHDLSQDELRKKALAEIPKQLLPFAQRYDAGRLKSGGQAAPAPSIVAPAEAQPPRWNALDPVPVRSPSERTLTLGASWSASELAARHSPTWALIKDRPAGRVPRFHADTANKMRDRSAFEYVRFASTGV